MKFRLFIALCAINLAFVFAQPTSGFYFGGNYTFVKDQITSTTFTHPTTGEEYTDIEQKFYTPKAGWQLGYTASIKISMPVSLTLGANITNKSVHYKWQTNNYIFVDEDQEAYYLCAPIALNYTQSKFFTGLGYEFGYDPGLSGVLNLQEYTHAALIQVGYRLWFFNLVAKYAIVLNKPVSGTYYPGDYHTTYYVPQNSTLQLSLVIGSPKFNHREEL